MRFNTSCQITGAGPPSPRTPPLEQGPGGGSVRDGYDKYVFNLVQVRGGGGLDGADKVGRQPVKEPNFFWRVVSNQSDSVALKSPSVAGLELEEPDDDDEVSESLPERETSDIALTQDQKAA